MVTSTAVRCCAITVVSGEAGLVLWQTRGQCEGRQGRLHWLRPPLVQGLWGVLAEEGFNEGVCAADNGHRCRWSIGGQCSWLSIHVIWRWCSFRRPCPRPGPCPVLLPLNQTITADVHFGEHSFNRIRRRTRSRRPNFELCTPGSYSYCYSLPCMCAPHLGRRSLHRLCQLRRMSPSNTPCMSSNATRL